MSEYQYYEFLAIDRPLSNKEIDATREFSSRAAISSTRFAIEYHRGDFRGNPEEFLIKWYDAMLYLANWGSHRFMCRVPTDLIELGYAKKCCVGDNAKLKIVGGKAVLFDFSSETEDGGSWVDDGEGAGCMASIAPIRAELIAGDRRPLYLAWLLCAQSGELDDDQIEPAVPPGLKKLSTAQTAFADFLRLDKDLITTAAATSPPIEKAPEGFEHWLRELPASEKDALLLALVNGTDPYAGGRLRRRFTNSKAVASSRPADAPRDTPRNVAQLLAASETNCAQREAHEREFALRARAEKEAAEKAARVAHLEQLSGREDQLWGKIDSLIGSKSRKNYDESVTLLRDLHDLADRRGTASRFAANLQSIVDRHIKKPSLIQRIQRSGLLNTADKSR